MKLPPRQSTPSRAAAAQESLGMLTRQDLAKQLHISTRTVDEWRQDKVIPCIKAGRIVLFCWPDVVSALREKYSVALTKAENAKAETLKCTSGPFWTRRVSRRLAGRHSPVSRRQSNTPRAV